jgi:hypothetical protein
MQAVMDDPRFPLCDTRHPLFQRAQVASLLVGAPYCVSCLLVSLLYFVLGQCRVDDDSNRRVSSCTTADRIVDLDKDDQLISDNPSSRV